MIEYDMFLYGTGSFEKVDSNNIHEQNAYDYWHAQYAQGQKPLEYMFFGFTSEQQVLLRQQGLPLGVYYLDIDGKSVMQIGKRRFFWYILIYEDVVGYFAEDGQFVPVT